MTKKQLFENAFNAVYDYKSTHEIHKDDESYRNAQKAVAAYANFSGITYEQACKLVMELF